jgi:hypothetical protein
MKLSKDNTKAARELRDLIADFLRECQHTDEIDGDARVIAEGDKIYIALNGNTRGAHIYVDVETN